MVLLLYHISHSNICVLQRKKIPFPLVLFTVDNFFTRLGNMVKEPVCSHHTQMESIRIYTVYRVIRTWHYYYFMKDTHTHISLPVQATLSTCHKPRADGHVVILNPGLPVLALGCTSSSSFP